MKHLFKLLLVVAIITGGVMLWQKFSFAGLSARLEKQTDAIAAGYSTLVETDVAQIASSHSLTVAQKRLVERMRTSVSAFSGSLSLQEKIEQITLLQNALQNFTNTETAGKSLKEDPTFQHVAAEVGEKGSLRALLKSYNETVARWNARIQSSLGSLTGQLDSVKRSMLPYLRFDGQQDFVPVISL